MRRAVAAAAAAAAAASEEWMPRPQYYFALRTTEPEPLLVGLGWASALAPDRGDFRHGAYTHHNLSAWGWTAHDADGFGRQQLLDPALNLNLSVTYVAAGLPVARGCRPWSARIVGAALDASAPPVPVALVSYLAAAAGHLAVEVDDAAGVHALVGARHVDGAHHFALLVETPGGGGGAASTLGARVAPAGDVWKVDDLMHEARWASWQAQAEAARQRAGDAAGEGLPPGAIVPALPDAVAAGSNVALVQHVFRRPPFELTWTFVDGSCAAAVGLDLAEEEQETEEEEGEGEGEEGAPPAPLVGTGWPHAVRAALGLDAGADAEAPNSFPSLAHAREAAYTARLCAALALCDGATPPDRLHVARHALGNLLGSITYFHGQGLVATAGWYEALPPASLYTGVPSRAYFPRGFLWDEGFHQVLAAQVNPRLSLRVLASWLSLMRDDGWIPREVILGDEARSRVHPDFWVQHPTVANPPTLVLALVALTVQGLCGGGGPATTAEEAAVRADGGASSDGGAGGVGDAPDRAAVARFCAAHVFDAAVDPTVCTFACRRRRGDEGGGHAGGANGERVAAAAAGGGELTPSETLAFARGAYPRLARHYGWFKRTQGGQRPDTWRWRGNRKGGHALVWHNFASGLDDYPRGKQADDRDENLDLLGWMTVTARSLAELAELSGDAGAAAGYRGDAARYTARLQEHWSDDAGSFCEVGVVGFDASARVELDADGNPPYLLPGARTGAVCHVGYVALVPLLFRMLPPDDARLAALLTSMEDPAQLASPWGLRALSRSDPLYGTELSFDNDYWRSSIWINFNFLAVAALRWYADAPGPHAARCGALADGLQERVVALVVGEFNRTGFIWEHYSSEHGGHGRGTHPFTGWSALVALMVAGRYPL